MTEPRRGMYQHFKGGIYFVLNVAKFSENPEKEFVIYADASGTVWARPLEMWSEMVIDPKTQSYVSRFLETNLDVAP